MSRIHFDPRNWDTVQDTIDKVNEMGCMQLGENEWGEDVTFDVCKDYDGNDALHITTYQTNGWIRHNYYYPNDYVSEELYEKGDNNVHRSNWRYPTNR